MSDSFDLPYAMVSDIVEHDGIEIAKVAMRVHTKMLPLYESVIQHDTLAVPRQKAYEMLVAGLCHFMNAGGSLGEINEVVDHLYNVPAFVDTRKLVFCDPAGDLSACMVFMDVDKNEFHMYEDTMCIAVMQPVQYELWYSEYVGNKYPWESGDDDN